MSMGTSFTIHPSQRRVSCDVCRRHKTRCQRIRQSDPKCARCTMLEEKCNVSGPKKVGRPRKPDSAAGQRPNTESTEQNNAKPMRPQQKETSKGQQNERSLSSVSPDSGIFLERDDQAGMAGMRFSATAAAAAPTIESTTNDVFNLVSSWPATWTSGVQFSLPPPALWDVASSYRHGFAFSDYDWNFNESDVIETASSRSDVTITCSDPDSLVIPELGVPAGSIELSDALSKLSKLNIDLHTRVAAIEAHRPLVNLNSLLYREGPLFIDNHTLAEFTMTKTQGLFHILSRLLNNRQCHAPMNNHHKMDAMSLSGPAAQSSQQPYGDRDNDSGPNPDSPFPSASPRPLLPPLALTITAVFTQLITLYETFLNHMFIRLENLNTDPVAPIPSLIFGQLLPQEPCMLGIRFSNVSVNLLERIEQILGINGRPEWGGRGLMSTRQIDVLWGELDSGEGVAPGHGFMRPAYVKRSLRKVMMLLDRIGSR